MRRLVVRRGIPEPQFPVKLKRHRHFGQRIEQHPLIADLARYLDGRQNEFLSQAPPAILRNDEQTLDFTRCFVERPQADAVADAPNRAEFAHGAPQRWSWEQLGEQVDRLCLLLIDAGIKRDDVIVAQLPNCVEQFSIYLACARLGLVVTPVPVQYRDHELGHILEVTQAAAAVTFARL